MDMMGKGKVKEFIIDLNNEDFDYQHNGNANIEFDEESMLVSQKILNGLTLEDVWKMEYGKWFNSYQTNAYRKLLVILVGINHHHQTLVIGCALLVDESVNTYT